MRKYRTFPTISSQLGQPPTHQYGRKPYPRIPYSIAIAIVEINPVQLSLSNAVASSSSSRGPCRCSLCPSNDLRPCAGKCDPAKLPKHPAISTETKRGPAETLDSSAKGHLRERSSKWTEPFFVDLDQTRFRMRFLGSDQPPPSFACATTVVRVRSEETVLFWTLSHGWVENRYKVCLNNGMSTEKRRSYLLFNVPKRSNFSSPIGRGKGTAHRQEDVSGRLKTGLHQTRSGVSIVTTMTTTMTTTDRESNTCRKLWG